MNYIIGDVIKNAKKIKIFKDLYCLTKYFLKIYFCIRYKKFYRFYFFFI